MVGACGAWLPVAHRDCHAAHPHPRRQRHAHAAQMRSCRKADWSVQCNRSATSKPDRVVVDLRLQAAVATSVSISRSGATGFRPLDIRPTPSGRWATSTRRHPPLFHVISLSLWRAPDFRCPPLLTFTHTPTAFSPDLMNPSFGCVLFCAHRPVPTYLKQHVEPEQRGWCAECGVQNAVCCYLTLPSTRSSLSSFPMSSPGPPCRSGTSG